MNLKIEKTSLENHDLRTDSLRNIFLGSFKSNIRQFTMVIALLSIWMVFSITTGGIFITSRNLSNLFVQFCSVAILSVGIVFVMVAGHIDLSVGRLAGFTGAVAAVLQVKMNLGTIPAILLTLVVGALIGVWQGFWIAYRGVPAFIVTLASYLAFQGAVLGVTGGNSIGPVKGSFKVIGQGYLPSLFIKQDGFNDTSAIIGIIFIILFIVFDLRKRKSRIKYGFNVIPMTLQVAKLIAVSVVIALVCYIMVSYMGIPYAILLLIGIAALFTFIATKTSYGRHVYAIGGNKEAARLSGINIKRRTMTIFIIMSLLSTIAGIILTARLNAATPSAGQNMELDAIAAAVIGGTSTMGGEGTIIGAIIGALVMASLDNGMSLMNMDTTYQYIIKGLILLLAVWVDIATRKKAA